MKLRTTFKILKKIITISSFENHQRKMVNIVKMLKVKPNENSDIQSVSQ